MISTIIDPLGEWNPQLLRELKGKLNTRNITVAWAISIGFQLLLYLFYESLLPITRNTSNHYCTGSVLDSYSGAECLKDALGKVIINWQRWWLDIFICMSIIAIFALLVGGTYLLIADLSKEESRGTLNFLRLSPQSARSILLGKILGVPIILYLLLLLGMPLHFRAALGAGIPLILLLGFYTILIASCAFFYSGALFYGLVSSALGGFQAWLFSGGVLFFLLLMSAFTMSEYAGTMGNVADWLTLFYPGKMLSYIVNATPVASQVDYLPLEQVTEITWFGMSLGQNAILGIFFMLLNYGIWTYWLGKALKRRFHNPIATSLSKGQSYLLTASLMTTMAGFSLPHSNVSEYEVQSNIILLFLFQLVLFLGLIAALSNHRQALQDWARSRSIRGKQGNGNLLKDLVWGEKSPATVAIGINLVIASLLLLPLLLLFPFGSSTIYLSLGVLFHISVILIYACVAQLILMATMPKRTIWAIAGVGGLMILPLIIAILFQINPNNQPFLWLFSILPIIGTENAMGGEFWLAFLIQWGAIAFLSLLMTKQLQVFPPARS